MSIRYVKYMVLPAALALLVSISAFARPKNERTVAFSNTVEIGTTQLRPGTYKVEWQGTDSALHVNFLRDGKIVATAQGKMVEKTKSFPSDEIVTARVQNNQKLEEIDFGGKKDALVFPANQTSMK